MRHTPMKSFLPATSPTLGMPVTLTLSNVLTINDETGVIAVEMPQNINESS